MKKSKGLASLFIMIMIFILSACNGNDTMETKIIGQWETLSFTLVEKEYDNNSNEAFLDGVMIAHMQMFFKEGEAVTFKEDGKVNFHGFALDYILEENNLITFSGKQFGDMKLTFILEEDGNDLLLKHDLGIATLASVE
jgi:hypothetical protein